MGYASSSPHSRREILEALVRLVATEKNTRLLISKISSNPTLLKQTRLICAENHLDFSSEDSGVPALCRSYQILPEYFEERLHVVVHSLGLGPWKPDYYKILELRPGADSGELKRAFRRLSLKYHPDLNDGDDEATQNFRTVREAYEVLSNERLRRQYDTRFSTPVREPVWEKDRLGDLPESCGFRWWSLHHVWYLGIPVLILILACFWIDYDYWMADRYYQVKQAGGQEQEENPFPDIKTISPGLRADHGKASSVPEAPGKKSGEDKTKAKAAKKNKQRASAGSENAAEPDTKSTYAGGEPRTDPEGTPFIPLVATAEKNAAPLLQTPSSDPAFVQRNSVPASEPAAGATVPSDVSKPIVSEKTVAGKAEVVAAGVEVAAKAEAGPEEVKDRAEGKKKDGVLKTAGAGGAVAGKAEVVAAGVEVAAKAEAGPEEVKDKAEGKKKDGVLKTAGAGGADRGGGPAKGGTEKTMGADSIRTPHPATGGGDGVHPPGAIAIADAGSEETGRRADPRAMYGRQEGRNADKENKQATTDDSAVRAVQFIDRYAEAYENLNFSRFLNFFEPDALENGHSLNSLIAVYSDNFRRAEWVRYRIHPVDFSSTEGGVRVSGNFRMTVKFAGESAVESKGVILLELVSKGTDFRIKRLDYKFKAQ